MGGRIGYSAATGVMVILLAWFGVISLMVALIPVVAIAPILLYIGMLIGSQAFQESPRRHAPAIILAIVPSLAAWGLMLINNALRRSRPGLGSGVNSVGEKDQHWQFATSVSPRPLPAVPAFWNKTEICRAFRMGSHIINS